MNHFGDDDYEMPHEPALADVDIEALLRGENPGAGLEDLAAFVMSARAVAEPVPVPSAALASIFSTGISTDNGDLSATAASNVNGPEPQASGLPKWRQKMNKIPQTIAGLSVAAKVFLGAGVAMAATTGAGAAGVLPGPVQNAVANAVADVTPFDLPHEQSAPPVASGGGHDGTAGTGNGGSTEPGAGAAPTPTTVADHEEPPAPPAPPSEPTPTTTAPVDSTPGDAGPGSEPAPAVTPPPSPAPAPAPAPSDDPAPPTPTTAPHPDNEGHVVPTTVQLNCTLVEGPKVQCDWSTITQIPGASYMLVRGSDTSNVGRVLWQGSLESGSFTDTLLVPGTTYSYLVLVNTWNGHPAEGRSNQVKISFAG